jgi:hypothetical protein
MHKVTFYLKKYIFFVGFILGAVCNEYGIINAALTKLDNIGYAVMLELQPEPTFWEKLTFRK